MKQLSLFTLRRQEIVIVIFTQPGKGILEVPCTYHPEVTFRSALSGMSCASEKQLLHIFRLMDLGFFRQMCILCNCDTFFNVYHSPALSGTSVIINTYCLRQWPPVLARVGVRHKYFRGRGAEGDGHLYMSYVSTFKA